MSKKTLLILGHPDKDSYCAVLAKSYLRGAEKSGREIRSLFLGEMDFDPVLHHGYKTIQELEPDLKKAQEDIKWAEHLVFVYPTWWGSMPAILKGFIDRIILPGFAYKFHEKGHGWNKLLKGKTAHLIVTMGAPAWYYNLVYAAVGHRLMKKNILGFCGVKTTKETTISSIAELSDQVRVSWIQKMEVFGEKTL